MMTGKPRDGGINLGQTMRRTKMLFTGQVQKGLQTGAVMFVVGEKRRVKAPKVYIRDSGVLHALLNINNRRDLENHPKVGASWEGYALEEVLKALQPEESYFWATHGGAELDMLLFKGRRRIGVECKRTDAPVLTSSMRIVLADLRLDELCVVYPGRRTYNLAQHVRVTPLADFVNAT